MKKEDYRLDQIYFSFGSTGKLYFYGVSEPYMVGVRTSTKCVVDVVNTETGQLLKEYYLNRLKPTPMSKLSEAALKTISKI